MPEDAAIPIIDISAEGADQAQVAKSLVDAAAEYGFVYIKNTGRDITIDQIENAFDVVGDFKEGFNFGNFDNGKATQPIPSRIEPHQAELAAFRTACHNLCQKILFLFGIGLGVDPPDFFMRAHSPDRPSGSILRFLYYPPPGATPEARDGDVRAGAHSDYGSVTLLFRLRGQAGLEILTPAGTWAPVPVCPPAAGRSPTSAADAAPPILVNIGDLLSYWTNGLLRSTVHRVAFGGGGGGSGGNGGPGESTTDPRYSIVYFCHPTDDTPLAAVPSERVKGFGGGSSSLAEANRGNPYAERKVLTAHEHLQMRLQATYLQLYGEEKKELA